MNQEEKQVENQIQNVKLISKKKYKFGNIIMLISLFVIMLAVVIATSANVNKSNLEVKNSLGTVTWKNKHNATFIPNFDDQKLNANGIKMEEKNGQPTLKYSDIFKSGKSFKKFDLNGKDSYFTFSEDTKTITFKYVTKKSYNRKSIRKVTLKVNWGNVVFAKDENDNTRFTVLKETLASNMDKRVLVEANNARKDIYGQSSISDEEMKEYDLVMADNRAIIHENGTIDDEFGQPKDNLKSANAIKLYSKVGHAKDSKKYQVRTYIQVGRINKLVKFELSEARPDYRISLGVLAKSSSTNWYQSDLGVSTGDYRLTKIEDTNKIEIKGDTFLYGAAKDTVGVALKYSYYFEANNEEKHKYDGGWRDDYFTLVHSEETIFAKSSETIDISEVDIISKEKFNQDKYEIKSNNIAINKLLGYELSHVEVNGNNIGTKFNIDVVGDSTKEVKFFYKRKNVAIEIRDGNNSKKEIKEVGLNGEYKFGDIIRINDLVVGDKSRQFIGWAIEGREELVTEGILTLDEKYLVKDDQYTDGIVFRAQYEKRPAPATGPVLHVDYKYEDVNGDFQYCEEEGYTSKRINRARDKSLNQAYADVFDSNPPNEEEFDRTKTVIYDEREKKALPSGGVTINKSDFMHLTIKYARRKANIELEKRLPHEDNGYIDDTKFKNVFNMDGLQRSIRYGSGFEDDLIDKLRVKSTPDQIIRQPGVHTRFKGWKYEESPGHYVPLNLETYVHRTRGTVLKLYATWEEPNIQVEFTVKLQNPDGLGYGAEQCLMDRIKVQYRGQLGQEIDFNNEDIKKEIMRQITTRMHSLSWKASFHQVFKTDSIRRTGGKLQMSETENKVEITADRRKVKLTVQHLSFDSEKIKDGKVKDRDELRRIEQVRQDLYELGVDTSKLDEREKLGLASVGYEGISIANSTLDLYRANNGEVVLERYTYALKKFKDKLEIGKDKAYDVGYFFINNKIELSNTYIVKKDDSDDVEVTYLYRPKQYYLNIAPDDKMDEGKYTRDGGKLRQSVRHMDKVVLKAPVAKKVNGEVKYTFEGWEYSDGTPISKYLLNRQVDTQEDTYVMPATEITIRPKWIESNRVKVKVEYIFEKSDDSYVKRDEKEARRPDNQQYEKGETVQDLDRFINLHLPTTPNTAFPFEGHEIDMNKTIAENIGEDGQSLIGQASNSEYYYKVTKNGVNYIKLYYRLKQNQVEFVNGYSAEGEMTGAVTEMTVSYKKKVLLPKEGIEFNRIGGGKATLRGWSRTDSPDSPVLDEETIFNDLADFTSGTKIVLYARWNYLTDTEMTARVEFEKPEKDLAFETGDEYIDNSTNVNLGRRSLKFDGQEPIDTQILDLKATIYKLVKKKDIFQGEYVMTLDGYEGQSVVKLDPTASYTFRVYRRTIDLVLEVPFGHQVESGELDAIGQKLEVGRLILTYKVGQQVAKEPALNSTTDEDFLGWKTKYTNKDFNFNGAIINEPLYLTPKFNKKEAVIRLMHGNIADEFLNYKDDNQGVKVKKDLSKGYTEITVLNSKLPYTIKQINSTNDIYYKTTHHPGKINGYSESEITTIGAHVVNILAVEDVDKYKDSYPQKRSSTYGIEQGHLESETINVTTRTVHTIDTVYYKGIKYDKVLNGYYEYEKVGFEQFNDNNPHRMSKAIDVAQFRDEHTDAALRKGYNDSYLKNFFDKYLLKKFDITVGRKIGLPKFADTNEVVASAVNYNNWREMNSLMSKSDYTATVINNYRELRKIGERKMNKEGYLFFNTYKKNGYHHEMIMIKGDKSSLPLVDYNKDAIAEGYASYIRLVEFA